MRLVVGEGVRATEDALCHEVARHLDEATRDPGRLARPLRIVVPSRPLRAHVATRLVAEGSRVGVLVQTLHGLMLEVLARAGVGLQDGHLLFPLIVRRLARGEDALREVLDPLVDGYAVAAQTAADLLDAGVLPAHLEGLEERLAAEVGEAEAARGAALVRVALAAGRELAGVGLVHRSALFREARLVLERDPGRLPASGILVHGYADATGVQADLLETLLRSFGGVAFVSEPQDPAAPGRPAPGRVFTERLRMRLGGLAEARSRVAAPTVAVLRAFAAPGAQVEAREVAERIGALLDEGAAPGRIGIVARDLDEYADPLETHLDRLGVPFGAGPGMPARLGPEGRLARALGHLLAEGEEAVADRWLDARACGGPLRERDLRLALHALGASRLRHAARLPLASLELRGGRYRLPVRHGVRDADPDASGTAGRQAPHRHLDAGVLEEARRDAAALLESLAGWPTASPLETHAARVRALVTGPLRRSPSDPGAARLLDRLDRLAQEVGSAWRGDREELRLLLERRTADLGRPPRGDAAGGVRVLTVMEARGLCFDHLFVLGLNRDRFPRPATPDPLLRDGARRRLEPLLPDIPIKARAFHEDRHLFAELCSAAPRVTLSWQAVSDDGRERPPSPLVERLRIEGGLPEPELVPGLFAPGRQGPRPAFEHAIVAGLAGLASGAQRAWEAALAERLGDRAPRVAAARRRAIAELEARTGLGPFLGRVGSGVVLRDAPSVTWLEALARCPWRAFLERVLRLEPLPDARTELPGLEAPLVGQVVHGVLERIVARAGAPVGGAIDPAAPAVDVPWPEPEAVEALLAETAIEVARERGATFPGFARALAARARPALEAVRRAEWPGPVRRDVLGAELDGVALVEGGQGVRRVRFRADRVDREDGVLRLVDYKTGRPPGSGGDLREAWRAEVERGLWLQGVAYAHLEGAQARGAYAFGRPDAGEETCEPLETGREDAPLAAAFAEATGVLFAAAEHGVLPPRLVGDDGATPRACTAWCEVRDACLQHDTTARWRVRRLRLEGAQDGDDEARLARRLLSMGPRG